MSTENLFRGINPILHTILQDTSKSSDPLIDNTSLWPSFHSRHINHLLEAIEAVLPPGYAVLSEQGLQVTSPDPARNWRPVPDISVWTLSGKVQPHVPARQVMTHEAQVIRLEVLEEAVASVIMSVAIYAEVSSHMRTGHPVTRIELLSPSNKPGGSGVSAFIKNYVAALKSGTSVITLDYLHESPSPFSGVARYPHESDSHPYHVSLADSRTETKDTQVYGFDVDSPIPTLTIPLAGDDNLSNFDFDGVYQYSYQRGPWSALVEREGKIERWHSYSRADQDRIIRLTNANGEI